MLSINSSKETTLNNYQLSVCVCVCVGLINQHDSTVMKVKKAIALNHFKQNSLLITFFFFN